MIPTLLAFVSALVLVLLVAVIYLNDRLRELERRSVGSLASEGWAGLGGKLLWDAMSGKPVAGVAAGTVAFLRPDYELILSKHIEGLFRDGLQDGRAGHARQAAPLRSITSTRGSVQSWIPPKSAAALYRVGADAARADASRAEGLRQAIDEIAGDLFSQVGLRLDEPFSRVLMLEEPEALAVPAASSPDSLAATAQPLPGMPSAAPEPAPGREEAPAEAVPVKAQGATASRFEAAVHEGPSGR